MAGTPTVYVICDQNCKFEGMTKEQIYAAIMQAVNGGTIGDIDAGFITTIKTINGLPLKFFVGEQAAYDALSDEEKENLFALITNDTTKEGITAAIGKLETDFGGLVEKLISGEFVVKNAKTAENLKELYFNSSADDINIYSSPDKNTQIGVLSLMVNYVAPKKGTNNIWANIIFNQEGVERYFTGRYLNTKTGAFEQLLNFTYEGANAADPYWFDFNIRTTTMNISGCSDSYTHTNMFSQKI